MSEVRLFADAAKAKSRASFDPYDSLARQKSEFTAFLKALQNPVDGQRLFSLDDFSQSEIGGVGSWILNVLDEENEKPVISFGFEIRNDFQNGRVSLKFSVEPVLRDDGSTAYVQDFSKANALVDSLAKTDLLTEGWKLQDGIYTLDDFDLTNVGAFSALKANVQKFAQIVRAELSGSDAGVVFPITKESEQLTLPQKLVGSLARALRL